MSKILKTKHPLMQNNFTKDDFDKINVFLKKKPILTQSKKVEEFESKWSNWLGAEEITKIYSNEIPIINIRLSNIYGPSILSRPDIILSIFEKIFFKKKVKIKSKIL